MPTRSGRLTSSERRQLLNKARAAGLDTRTVKIEQAASTLEDDKRGVVAATAKDASGKYVGVTYDYSRGEQRTYVSTQKATGRSDQIQKYYDPNTAVPAKTQEKRYVELPSVRGQAYAGRGESLEAGVYRSPKTGRLVYVSESRAGTRYSEGFAAKTQEDRGLFKSRTVFLSETGSYVSPSERLKYSLQPSSRTFPQEEGRYTDKLRYRPGIVGSVAKTGLAVSSGYGRAEATTTRYVTGKLFAESNNKTFLDAPPIQRAYRFAEEKFTMIPVRGVKDFYKGIGRGIITEVRDKPLKTGSLLLLGAGSSTGAAYLTTIKATKTLYATKAIGTLGLAGYGVSRGYEFYTSPTLESKGSVLGKSFVETSALSLGSLTGANAARNYYTNVLARNTRITGTITEEGGVTRIKGTATSRINKLTYRESFDNILRTSTVKQYARKGLYVGTISNKEGITGIRGQQYFNVETGVSGGSYRSITGSGEYSLRPTGQKEFSYESVINNIAYRGVVRDGRFYIKGVGQESLTRSLSNAFKTSDVVSRGLSANRRGSFSIPRYNDFGLGTGGTGGISPVTPVVSTNINIPTSRLPIYALSGGRFSFTTKPSYLGIPSFGGSRQVARVTPKIVNINIARPSSYNSPVLRTKTGIGSFVKTSAVTSAISTSYQLPIARTITKIGSFSGARPITGTGTSPKIPPPISPPEIPRFDFGGFGGFPPLGGSLGRGRSRRGSGAGRRYSYAPSLVSLSLGIRGRVRVPKGGFTGLEIRPIPI